MSKTACQISGIVKSFGPNRVLQEINLELPAGMITVLMGANGAGKSTLVKILCGVHQADAGSDRFIFWVKGSSQFHQLMRLNLE